LGRFFNGEFSPLNNGVFSLFKTSNRRATLYVDIGNVYGAKGEFDQALNYYVTIRDTFGRLGLQNIAEYGDLLYNMAFAYEKKGDIAIAGKHYRQAYETYQKCGRADWAEDARKNAERLGY
jgi:tetratricopeptide (TPR) repeat protein